MSNHFESIQTVEVISLMGETSSEVEFVIDLKCTARSIPGFFSPIDGGEPPCGPEFEVTSVTVGVPVVKPEQYQAHTYVVFTLDQFSACVGEAVADELIEAAMADAAFNGDF